MSGHSATFLTSTATPLFSTTWAPTTVGAYAGTCIFLIALALLLRVLLAAKQWQEEAWLDAEFKRRYVAVRGKPTLGEQIRGGSEDGDKKRLVLSENGVEEEVMVVRKRGAERRPWRFSVDPVRAVLDTVIAGIGYLLMLAVMTMNVGYFMSVLGGVFLGSLALGRYTTSYEGH